MREFSGPNVTTIRESVRYRPAARKAGAMVRQTICIKKPGWSADKSALIWRIYTQQENHPHAEIERTLAYLEEGIMVAHDATDIAQNLYNTPAYQGYREPNEAPREGHLEDETAQRERKESKEGGVRSQRGPVVVEGRLDRAGCESAVFGVGVMLIRAPEQTGGVHSDGSNNDESIECLVIAD